MIVYLNNTFIDINKARIGATDRGFTLGDGVFDTMLCVNGAPQDFKLHMSRLLAHAAVLRINTTHTVESLEPVATALLRRNGFKSGRHVLRTTLTRGPGERGLFPPETPTPTLLMTLSPAPESALVHAAIATGTRRNGHSPLSRIKSLQYGDNLLALLEAKERGANEALIMNTEDHVVCGSTSNIFILEEDRVLTPPLSDGALDGITRAGIMRTIRVKEHSLTVERLRMAEGIYLTNSVYGIRPVEMLDGQPMASRNAFFENLVTSLSLPAAA